MSKNRKTYSKTFKLEALRKMHQPGQSVSQLAEQLGLRRNLLYKWKQQQQAMGEAAFSGRGRSPVNSPVSSSASNQASKINSADTLIAGKQNEIQLLQQQLAKLQQENQLLKQAAAYFARQIDA